MYHTSEGLAYTGGELSQRDRVTDKQTASSQEEAWRCLAAAANKGAASNTIR
jgi:hypothetical protein